MMALAEYKDDLDSLVAQMPPAPSHPILSGVKRPDKGQKVLDSFELYETSLMKWRTTGLSILSHLRRNLRHAIENGETDAVLYAVSDTIPQCVSAIYEVQKHLNEPWPALDEIEQRIDLAASDKRFIKYLRKRVRDFSRSMSLKLEYLGGAFTSLPREFGVSAINDIQGLQSWSDGTGNIVRKRTTGSREAVATMNLTTDEIEAIMSARIAGKEYNLSDIPD